MIPAAAKHARPVEFAHDFGFYILVVKFHGFRIARKSSQNQKGLRRLRDGERRAASAVTDL